MPYMVAIMVWMIADSIGVLGAIMVVYFPVEKLRAAWTHSKIIISPIVIAACGLALWRLLTTGHLPPVRVNGFAMMAIAGALIRMLPYPKECQDSN